MTGDGWNLSVFDEFQWIAGSCVFGEGGIEIVDLLGFWIEDDVFEDSSELDGSKNFWFFIFVEVNAFGIAAAFDVKDTLVGPDMFVVTDEFSVTDGAEGGFTGS